MTAVFQSSLRWRVCIYLLVNGWLVFTSEPQFWFNLNALKKVNDNMNLSIGTELELSQNFVWPTNGTNNRFYAIPTFALKWTF